MILLQKKLQLRIALIAADKLQNFGAIIPLFGIEIDFVFNKKGSLPEKGALHARAKMEL